MYYVRRFIGVFVYLYLRFGYGPFSKFMRWAFGEAKIVAGALPQMSIEELLEFFKRCTWTPDPLRGMVDYISTPEEFWITMAGDCDEYAVFAGNVLPVEYCPMILSVPWWNSTKGQKTLGGHNVCLIYAEQGWAHIGNWGIKYLPLKKDATAQDLVNAAILDILPPNSHNLAWSLRDPKTLKWFYLKPEGRVMPPTMEE